MAMIAIPLAQDTSRLFREIEVDGHRDPSDHITLFYLGDDLKLDTLMDIIPILYEVTNDMKPFEVICSKLTSFPKGNYGYPFYAEIKSDQLKEIRNKIKKLLDKNKIDYNNNFPDYNPHVTLAYCKKKPKNIKLPYKLRFPLTQIALYGGDEVDSKFFVNFPFTLGVEKKSNIDIINKLANDFNHLTKI